jgi:hypothetical protein
MLSAVLFCLLWGPCEGQYILPRQVIAVPVTAVVRVPVKAVAALAKTIRNREHKPVLRAVKAVVGREHRIERRGE